jgi:formylglycine-generating enzyme required for sulfatase activity
VKDVQKDVSSEKSRPGIDRLRATAREYHDALEQANATLPREFPIDQMRQIIDLIQTIDVIDDDLAIFAFIQDKLRNSRRLLTLYDEDSTLPSYKMIAHAQDALFVGIDDFLQAKRNSRVLIELSESHVINRSGDIPVIRHSDLAPVVASLEQRIKYLERSVLEAQTVAASWPISISLVNINVSNIKVKLDSLFKFAGTLSAELKASLIDLSWVAELAKHIGEVAKGLRESIETAGRLTGRLADFLALAEVSVGYSKRVVNGSKALLWRVKRQADRQARRGVSVALSSGVVFRDINEVWCPEMVVIAPGNFRMGSSLDEPGAYGTERPQHAVAIDYWFALGRYPVTEEEYQQFIRETKRDTKEEKRRGKRMPATGLSWEDASLYCQWLSERSGVEYRLPSEAEWEFACRAGTTTRYWWGDAFDNSRGNAEGGVGKPSAVDTYPPNPWGLYDIHGNVWEWCSDTWHNNYSGNPPTDGFPMDRRW